MGCAHDRHFFPSVPRSSCSADVRSRRGSRGAGRIVRSRGARPALADRSVGAAEYGSGPSVPVICPIVLRCRAHQDGRGRAGSGVRESRAHARALDECATSFSVRLPSRSPAGPLQIRAGRHCTAVHFSRGPARRWTWCRVKRARAPGRGARYFVHIGFFARAVNPTMSESS